MEISRDVDVMICIAVSCHSVLYEGYSLNRFLYSYMYLYYKLSHLNLSHPVFSDYFVKSFN